MAFNDNYDSLKTAVQEWAQRADSEAKLVARIPDFIFLAETRLNRDLELASMLQLQFVNTVSQDPWLSIPSRYKKMRSLRIVGEIPIVSLKYRTPIQMDQTPGTGRVGRPAFYSISGDRIRLGPIPDGTYRVEMYFWQAFLPLDDVVVSTNWWLENAPDALLFGSLLELAPFIKDTEDLKVWQSRYTNAKEELREATSEFLWAGELTQQTDFNVAEPPTRGF